MLRESERGQSLIKFGSAGRNKEETGKFNRTKTIIKLVMTETYYWRFTGGNQLRAMSSTIYITDYTVEIGTDASYTHI